MAETEPVAVPLGPARTPSSRDALTGQGAERHLLSRNDIETEYGLTKRWLELAALRGNGPPFLRISRRLVRYRRADFERWLAAHERCSTSETTY